MKKRKKKLPWLEQSPNSRYVKIVKPYDQGATSMLLDLDQARELHKILGECLEKKDG